MAADQDGPGHDAERPEESPLGSEGPGQPDPGAVAAGATVTVDRPVTSPATAITARGA